MNTVIAMRKLDTTEDLKPEDIIPIGELDYVVLFILNETDILVEEIPANRVLH